MDAGGTGEDAGGVSGIISSETKRLSKPSLTGLAGSAAAASLFFSLSALSVFFFSRASFSSATLCCLLYLGSLLAGVVTTPSLSLGESSIRSVRGEDPNKLTASRVA